MDTTTIILIVYPITFILLILGILYLNKKYPEPSKKLDPIVKGVLITCGIFAVFVITAAVLGEEYIPKEWVKNSLPLFIIAMILLIGFYSIIVYYKQRPIKLEKLYKKALDDIYHWYKAREYIGKAYNYPLLFHRVYAGKTAEKEDILGVVDSFLITVKGAVPMVVLITLNIYTAQNVEMIVTPPYDIISSLFGEKAVSVYKQVLKEFDEEKDKEEKEEEGK